MAHADKAAPAALASLAAEIGELLDGAGLTAATTGATTTTDAATIALDAMPRAKTTKRAGARAAGKQTGGKRAAAKQSAAEQAERKDAASVEQGAASSSRAELVETFAVWVLDARALARAPAAQKSANKSGAKLSKKSGGRLRVLAKPTGRWHHQIKVGGRATAFARSSGAKLRLDRATLGGLFVSPLAAAVEEAVGWIDRHEPDARDGLRDPVVRLLVAPSHHLNALWLYDERAGTSEVLVITAPARLRPKGRKRLLGEEEFLELLRRGRPVRGLD